MFSSNSNTNRRPDQEQALDRPANRRISNLQETVKASHGSLWSAAIRNALKSAKRLLKPAKARRSAHRYDRFRKFAALGTLEHLEPRVMLATDTWTGAGADSNWSTPGNWSGNVAPHATGDTLVFPASASAYTSNNDDVTSVVKISFSGGGYTLTGNALTVSASGVGISDVGNNVIALGIGSTGLTLGTAQTFTVSSGTLLVSSPLVLGTANKALTVTGAGNLTVTGAISGGPAAANNAIVKGAAVADTGTLTLTSANSYTGITGINDGIVNIQNAAGAGHHEQRASSEQCRHVSTPGGHPGSRQDFLNRRRWHRGKRVGSELTLRRHYPDQKCDRKSGRQFQSGFGLVDLWRGQQCHRGRRRGSEQQPLGADEEWRGAVEFHGSGRQWHQQLHGRCEHHRRNCERQQCRGFERRGCPGQWRYRDSRRGCHATT